MTRGARSHSVSGTRLAARSRGAAAVAAVALTGCGSSGPAVAALDGEGREYASAPLPADGRFALTYRHSVYKATAEERFRATDGGFELDAVASRDGRVLDYYELDGDRTREGDVWVLHPYEPAKFRTMPLAATRRGQRTLVAGGQRVPLYGGPVHLRLVVER
ncbi:DUF1850 domain-containing protein [Solirubrobacter sp. CPCC 204708]|uniref:DUF1850 domain-containing protein n=1 Tax=Solirubrobacter deserti TaxID=2282478 RepID=A0ABT4RGR4_9ACTN|nr:DUF1850 domain-containing protein [Solirubrobacter deserti]MBE2315444.1 DUF1850 domain-containing protein [Solirubrobacter deserti]MDA0137714.1 DUF1850 domain-containing protein [Solirubrobacter deserti]